MERGIAFGRRTCAISLARGRHDGEWLATTFSARPERDLALLEPPAPCRGADVGLLLQESLEIPLGYAPTRMAALAPKVAFPQTVSDGAFRHLKTMGYIPNGQT